MEKPRPVLDSITIEGLQVAAPFSEDVFKKALKYKPRDDDIFIATYPKCGTTWAQQILYLLFNKGRTANSFLELMSQAPYLELVGPDVVAQMTRPGAIKVHLPFRMTPYSAKAKYIYVTRNPKDCCVSYYYHNKMPPIHNFAGTFDDYFELFVTGRVDYGDYFDHLLGWYARRNDPNVLFLVYERMKADPRSHLLKIAGFLGQEYLDMLEKDEELVETILKRSSFDFMKENINKMLAEMINMPIEQMLGDSAIPEGFKHVIAHVAKHHDQQPLPQVSNFVRKGIVGDWKNHFSPDQLLRMEKRTLEKTAGSDVMDLWKDVEGL